jgi:hypothetical protein
MWVWMYVTRVPAIMKSRMRLDPNAVRGAQMAELPAKVRWKADNYNHLFEQPTVFYAVALSLALLGDQSSLSLGLAWAYVGIRVVHSVWQSLTNIIEVRFVLFVSMSLVLMVLTVRAALLLVA